jgi:hypothetical protein
MSDPYRTPGTVDQPPPKRWGATRSRKWLYLYLRTAVWLADRVAAVTGVAELRRLELTRDDQRAVVRGILRSLSREKNR